MGHARIAHVIVYTIKRSAQHEVATGLDIKPSAGAVLPCFSCIGGKLARHTFPDKGSDANEAQAIMHIDLCGPFRVAAKDGSLYFLLLKDRKTRYVWVKPVAKKSDVLWVFEKWLAVMEQQAKKSVLMLRSCRGGEFLGKDFTDFHHWWHLILRQAAWVRNYLERSVLPPKTTPHQLLTSKKPDLTLARVCGCMVQFMVTDHQHSGKLAPKARSGLHLCVSPESKGWEVLNNVVTTVEAVFYKNLSLGLWKAEYGPASTRAPSTPQTDSSSVVLPMLAEDGEPDAEDAKDGIPTPLPSDVTPSATPSPSPSLPVVDLPRMGSTLVAGDVGILGALPAAPPGEQPAENSLSTGEPSASNDKSAGEPTTVEKLAEKPTLVQQPEVNKAVSDDEGELLAEEESTDSDVVEVPVEKPTRSNPEDASFR
ncbi:unnamed protein product [Closterium sp. NIES-53]